MSALETRHGLMQAAPLDTRIGDFIKCMLQIIHHP